MAKRNPNFQNDAKRYGRNVAEFNDGFLKGWDDGNRKGFKAGFKRCSVLLASVFVGRPKKWTDAERRLFNEATRLPKRKGRCRHDRASAPRRPHGR